MKNIVKIKVLIAITILLACSLQIFGQSKFPDTTATGLYNAIKSEVDPARMEEMLRFMQNGADGPSKTMLLDVSKQIVAVAFAEKGNITRATYWLGQINDQMWKEQASFGILRGLLETKQIAAAEAILKPIIEGSPSALFEGSKEKYFFYYGTVLYEKGKYKEALTYLTPQSSSSNRGNSELYALALMKAGNTTEAMTEVLSQIRKSNINNAEFIASAKQLFVKMDGNDVRFKSLIDSVTAVKNKHIQEKVAKMAINQPAPDFEITTVDGKTVSLKSLKGKTIILDFWATWCVPCVASFPAMQKAVDYYKKDNSVVFLFVHSYEKVKSTATEGAKKLIASKKYTFDVYMDLTNDQGQKSPMAASFKVSSLPTKILIDKDGIMRYRNSGFIGVDEAIPEIKMMVEMSQTK